MSISGLNPSTLALLGQFSIGTQPQQLPINIQNSFYPTGPQTPLQGAVGDLLQSVGQLLQALGINVGLPQSQPFRQPYSPTNYSPNNPYAGDPGPSAYAQPYQPQSSPLSNQTLSVFGGGGVNVNGNNFSAAGGITLPFGSSNPNGGPHVTLDPKDQLVLDSIAKTGLGEDDKHSRPAKAALDKVIGQLKTSSNHQDQQDALTLQGVRDHGLSKDPTDRMKQQDALQRLTTGTNIDSPAGVSQDDRSVLADIAKHDLGDGGGKTRAVAALNRAAEDLEMHGGSAQDVALLRKAAQDGHLSKNPQEREAQINLMTRLAFPGQIQ